MQKTQIEWVKNPDGTPGYTWNPITGCLGPEGKGPCLYCYARRLAYGRLKQRYLANKNLSHDYRAIKRAFDTNEPFTDPFYPRFWPERLEDVAVGSGKGIFVCDMGELFGDWVPREWQTEVFRVIRGSPDNRFYLLTKCPWNLLKWSPFPQNVYLGITVTNQEMFNKAIYYLKMVDAKVKFLSMEPLLEHIIID